MPAEGAISVISNKIKKPFGTLKIAWDFCEIIIGVVLSLIFFGGLVGVREGTIIAAFLVGLVVQFCNKHFAFVNRLLNGEEEPTLESVAAQDAPLVITIEREFGTGGHEIGEAIAKKLGIAFYDQSIIAKTADAAGMGVEEIQKQEEKLPLGLIYSLYNQSYAASHNISKQDAIFAAQSKVLRELASKESCVIVGRLGAYVLKGRPNTFNVFISADSNFRAEQISQKFHVSRRKAKELVRREDTARASYCHHFTNAPWGLATHYNLALDSSIYGLDSSVDLIMNALEIHQANKPRLKEMYAERYPEPAEPGNVPHETVQ
ncbi:MAG: cytidylate kinase family protein [Parasporobacterium sp.]|nr:cytidylate kinase family protein [Parasporobacterium sp.]